MQYSATRFPSQAVAHKWWASISHYLPYLSYLKAVHGLTHLVQLLAVRRSKLVPQRPGRWHGASSREARRGRGICVSDMLGVILHHSCSKSSSCKWTGLHLAQPHVSHFKATHGASPAAAACIPMQNVGVHRRRADGMAKAAGEQGEEEEYV